MVDKMQVLKLKLVAKQIIVAIKILVEKSNCNKPIVFNL